MAREGGDEREGERGTKKFSALFLWVFFVKETCIRTRTHKGMLLKYAGGPGAGGGGTER